MVLLYTHNWYNFIIYHSQLVTSTIMKCFFDEMFFWKLLLDSIVIVTVASLGHQGMVTFEKLTKNDSTILKQPRCVCHFFALNLINLHSPNIIERNEDSPISWVPKWPTVHRSNWPREAHQYYQGVGNVDPSYIWTIENLKD